MSSTEQIVPGRNHRTGSVGPVSTVLGTGATSIMPERRRRDLGTTVNGERAPPGTPRSLPISRIGHLETLLVEAFILRKVGATITGTRVCFQATSRVDCRGSAVAAAVTGYMAETTFPITHGASWGLLLCIHLHPISFPILTTSFKPHVTAREVSRVAGLRMGKVKQQTLTSAVIKTQRPLAVTQSWTKPVDGHLIQSQRVLNLPPIRTPTQTHQRSAPKPPNFRSKKPRPLTGSRNPNRNQHS